MERVEQGEYMLPYFVNRVFTRTALFQSRLADLEHLSASDVFGQIMVFHSILDDLLSSVEPYALEKALGRETLAGELITLRGLWSEVYERLFDPYLDEVRECRPGDGGGCALREDLPRQPAGARDRGRNQPPAQQGDQELRSRDR